MSDVRILKHLNSFRVSLLKIGLYIDIRIRKIEDENKKMKSYVRIDPVSQEVIVSEVSIPVIQPDEVLVKVEAFGVGIHDRYFIPANVDFPYTIGSEGAGAITTLGSQGSGFEIGEKVVFTTVLQPQGGCWAEYAAVKQTALIVLPDNLTFPQGAAIPIAGKTALECMKSLDLYEGDTLFIAGASGAIGTLVIQLAAAEGIRISGSASARNHEYMKSLGAEKTVDYHDPNWKNEVIAWSKGGVTAALAIQPGTGIDSIKVVKEGGKLTTVSGDSGQVVAERNITVRQMEHTMFAQKELTHLVNAISKGEMLVAIEKEYPFNQALDALQKTETRHARGKLVVNGRI